MPAYAVKTVQCLTAGEARAWTRIQASNPACASPYMSPDFFRAVARFRDSARVIVVTDGSEPVAFLPFHTGRLGLARPIGGPLNDYHGVIALPGTRCDVPCMLQAAGIGSFDLRHALVETLPGATLEASHDFHIMDLTAGFDAYEAERAVAAKSAFRTLRTRLAKAEKRFGAVSMTFHDDSGQSLARLIGWKRDQFAATGQIDVLEVRWVRALVEALHQHRSGQPRLTGQLSSLWFGDRLAAVHFGLRSPEVLHYWFPAYDPDLAELSPGNLLVHAMAKAAAAEGVREIHLGSGDYRYKLEFANAHRAVAAGVLRSGTLLGRGYGAVGSAMSSLTRQLPAALARLPLGTARRIDRHLAFHAL